MSASTVRLWRAWRAACRVLVLGTMVGLATPAGAVTITVSNTNDSGPGSLREAIASANADAFSDVIAFDIPGPGTHTIAPTSALPTITGFGTTIDGYTQSGALANTLVVGDDAVIKIRIDGASAGLGASGLAICADTVVVRGLSITRFNRFGVAFGQASNSTPCGTRPDTVALEGSFIGLAPDGHSAAGNGGTGVVVRDADNARIGGSPAARNLIAANAANGISAVGDLVASTIAGNYVGTDRSGLLNRGNAQEGISIPDSAPGLTIGGAMPNRIAFNQTGIRVFGSAHAAFVANEILANDSLGIDLSGGLPSGVTPNDVDDLDAGPNGQQNFPVLTVARRSVTAIGITGTLDRPAGPNPVGYAISVYSSATCDASGHGEGERLLGVQGIVLPNGSSEVFGFGLITTPPLLGSQITATATDAAGNTSEFSACIPLEESTIAIVVTTTADAGAGSLRQAIIDANADVDASVIAFDIPGTGPHTIALLSVLPTITAPVLIDGYTQTGAVPNSLADGDDAAIMVRIDDGASVSSLFGICADDVTLRGLSITRFSFPVRVGVTTAGVLCAAPSDTVIEGNFIGLAADGTTLAANAQGIGVFRGSNVRIGGEAPAQRNLIAGATGGVSFVNSASTGGVVCNNFIGTDRSGTLDRGSDGAGVSVGLFVPLARIGCAAPNRIAFNAVGIDVTVSAAGADLSGNDIFANDALGIDLIESGPQPEGITANDLDDIDAGGNGLQNFPTITLAANRDGTLVMQGMLDVPASTTDQIYKISAHENTACDASGNGEGDLFLGSVNVRLSNSAEGFEIELPNAPEPGATVTTTATDPNGNTSEFSTCATVLDGDVVFRDGFEG